MKRFLGTFWKRPELDRQIAEELEFHIEEATRANVESGMSPGEARRAARLQFGNPARLQDETREADLWIWLDTVARESRQSLRSLLRRPGLACTIVLSLALGIGANSAIFSVVDALLLKPVALPDPGRLIVIEERKNGRTMGGNPARLLDWGAQVTGLESAAGLYTERVGFLNNGGAEKAIALRTIGSAMAVFKAPPALGRGFSPGEERAEGDPVVMLSHGCWLRRFGADPAVLGRTVQLGQTHYTVIGVLSKAINYPEKVAFAAPAPREYQRGGRRAQFLLNIARIKPGVTPEQLLPQFATVASRLAREYPETDAGISAQPLDLMSTEASEARKPALILMGAVGFVLVIACVNIAGLLLSRAAERRHESRIRMQLGAGISSLIRLFFLESLWLVLGGCLAGLALAALGVEFLKKILPPDLPRLDSASVDLQVVAFAAGVSLLCAILFGFLPALEANPGPLRPRRFWTRRTLVAGQMALSLVLLTGAGLLVRSLLLIESSPLGFAPGHLLTVDIGFPWDTPKSRIDQFRDRALESFIAIPGVRAAGFADRLPLHGGSQSGTVTIQGRAVSPEFKQAEVYKRAVSAGYFAAMNTPLKQGQPFGESAAREAVVNETFVRKYFPAGDALGHSLTFDTEWFRIAGVVADLPQRSMEKVQPAEVYISARNTYWPLTSFVLRVQGDPAAFAASVRAQVRAIDRLQIIDDIAAMDEKLREVRREPRVLAWLVLGFALTALGLAAIGLYGVLASDVTQRTPEIGIRMALGARPEQVLWLTARGGLAVVLVGLAVGSVASLAFTRLLANLLFGIGPLDAFAFGGAALALITASAAALYLPARRASRIDPIRALRRE